MIIFKLDHALIMRANWRKLCQPTHFKLFQAKIMLLPFLHKLAAGEMEYTSDGQAGQRIFAF